jgi:periodic tryptophan protein 1
MMGAAAFEDGDNNDDNIDNEKNDDDEEFDDSDDDGDDDDLEDAPDTREYMPLDVEGLQSLGIGGTGGGGRKKEGGYTMEDLQNMTMNNADEDDDEDDDDDQEDVDDIQLRDTDALLVVAKTEEDFASLEINIFDTESSNLYVHHDIPLPSYPLCLALGCVVSSYDNINNSNTARAGNYVAVGSFEPGIEIWNLDVMNALEPTLVLGGMDTSGAEEDWMRMQQTIGQPASTTIGGGRNTKKHKSKTKKSGSGCGNTGLREGSHTDAIMGLSWNSIHRQVLASASADCTVKLWDVTQATHETYIRPSATLTHHTDKVQSLAWHPTEGTLLATGGYDRRVCLVDARSAAAVSTANNNNNNCSVKMVKLLADCEALAWDPHNQQYLTAASEDGTVVCYDVRKFNSDPVWSFVAHEYGGVSDIAYNNNIPGMFITCSIDKTVALWDTQQGSPSSSIAPQPCGSKEMSVGKLYSVSCYPSSPWLLACGGSGNELAIWDMEGEEAICNRFASRVVGGGGNVASTVEETSGTEDFEAIMANDTDTATTKALESMNKSKKKKGKKKSKAHKR